MTETVVPVPVEASRVELGVIRANKPAEVIAAATEAATALASVIEDRKLYSNIQGKKFVRAEGWTTLAAILGVTPHEVSVMEVEGTYTATVELRRLTDGVSIGRASAECGPDEPSWGKRPKYARRSMALTRATGKACRLAFSWVMALAGYEVTPAEEVASTSHDDDTGEVLERATDEQITVVFAEAARAGITKETFPAFYTEVTGRPWKTVYEGDVRALLAESAKRIAKKREKVTT